MECGQFFNWTREGKGYRVAAWGKEFRVRQEGGDLVFSGAPSRFIRRFFALDHDPSRILRSMPQDPSLKDAYASFGRLRLLRQEPWECLVAFLLTPTSNIPRIQRNVRALYAETGFRVRALRDEGRLRALGAGFRARYIADAAANRRFLKGGRDSLKRILGVGDKVADCVMLFAFGDYGSFPIDVWTRRILRRLYRRRLDDKRLPAWAREHFGPWAGYAQQWLYAWARGKAF